MSKDLVGCPRCYGNDVEFITVDQNYDMEWLTEVFCCVSCGTEFEVRYNVVEVVIFNEYD